jgi:hypothetical protein
MKQIAESFGKRRECLQAINDGNLRALISFNIPGNTLVTSLCSDSYGLYKEIYYCEMPLYTLE